MEKICMIINNNRYDELANVIEEKIDMRNIQDSLDLERRLEKFFAPKQTNEPTINQLGVMADYYNVPKTIMPDTHYAPVKIARYMVNKKEYEANRIRLSIPSRPREKEYLTVIVPVTGFKKRQIRDIRTGRVLKWIE